MGTSKMHGFGIEVTGLDTPELTAVLDGHGLLAAQPSTVDRSRPRPEATSNV